ncbi:MAG TPA: CDP-alcohol phosphatidyltransferase family protein [Vicinamibacterales bacterium]
MASPADAFDRRNLLTYASLLGGVAAVAAASRHHPNVAGVAIALSVVADTFDGRFARRFGADPRRTALGVELDSLSDAIAFGIAPPLSSALLLNAGTGLADSALWAAVFVHAACAVTRLASYNLGAMGGDLAPTKPRSGEGGKPVGADGGLGPPKPVGRGGFIGIPVPLAALIWATALLVQPSAAATTMLIMVTAAAMVLPLRIPRPTGAALVAFTLWALAVACLHATTLWR